MALRESNQPSRRFVLGPWKKAALLVGALVAVTMLGLMEEDYRAEVRLRTYKARLLASGEKLSISDFVSPMPAAGSNGAAEFLAAPAFPRGGVWLPLCLMVAPGVARVAWQQDELSDDGTNAWPQVLRYLGTNQPALIAIRKALEKPELVFPSDYSKAYAMELPHLEVMMSASGVFSIAAVAEMRFGNHALALDHLHSGIVLVSRWREPVSVSQEIRSYKLNQLAVTTWELLQSHAWEEAQLAELQRAWQSFDLHTDWLTSVTMDRAMLPAYFDYYRREVSAWGGVGCSACATAVPSLPWDEQLRHYADRARDLTTLYAWVSLWRLGFSNADELFAWELHQKFIGRVREAVALDRYAPAETWPSYRWGTGGWANSMLRGSANQVPKHHHVLKMARAETVRRLAFTATALHRYRHRHQMYPASLGEMVPELLAEVPRDFMDGQPLRYRRKADGQFALWSVGEDLKDDEGDATFQNARIGSFLRGRDMVWPQVATQAEVDAYNEAQALERAEREAERAAWESGAGLRSRMR